MKYIDNGLEIPIDLKLPEGADYISLDRLSSGNAEGKISGITYRDDGSSGTVMAQVNFIYDDNGRLSSIEVQ